MPTRIRTLFQELNMSTEQLLKTPLHALHIELGARMVPFAGYDMPVQYPLGVMKEHQHTRDQAGLFDVSHMGQIDISGAGADVALEALMPGDFTTTSNAAKHSPLASSSIASNASFKAAASQASAALQNNVNGRLGKRVRKAR